MNTAMDKDDKSGEVTHSVAITDAKNKTQLSVNYDLQNAGV